MPRKRKETMDKKEILNLLAGSLANLLIAHEIMGWTIAKDQTWDEEVFFENEEKTPELLLDFTRHMGAAWEVVDQITLENKEDTVDFRCMYLTNNDEGAHAIFVKRLPDNANIIYEARADIMPLAICRAALLVRFGHISRRG